MLGYDEHSHISLLIFKFLFKLEMSPGMNPVLCPKSKGAHIFLTTSKSLQKGTVTF